jgi:hypothetical protein
MKSSATRPSQARRLLRQSQGASGAGSAVDSIAATRPIQVASGAGPKSFGRSALLANFNDESSAAVPTPAAVVVV